MEREGNEGKEGKVLDANPFTPNKFTLNLLISLLSPPSLSFLGLGALEREWNEGKEGKVLGAYPFLPREIRSEFAHSPFSLLEERVIQLSDKKRE